MERTLMKVKKNGSAGDGARFVHLAMQGAQPGCGAPMDTVHGVAGLVGPDTCNAGGVFKQAVREPNLADGSSGGEVVPFKRNDFRIDHQELWGSGYTEATIESKQVPTFKH